MYWRWPFEEEIDVQDTSMGNITANQEMNYTMTIHTQAAESVRTSDQDIEKNDAGEESGSTLVGAAKTGDTTMTGIWFALLAVSGTVILCMRKKRHL